MSFRYLLVDLTGVVTGTNDNTVAESFAESDDVNVMIDTEVGTFSNEDDADQPITERFTEDYSEADDDSDA